MTAAKLPAAAAFYAEKLTWPIFPLKPKTKVPDTAHGFKARTTDLAAVQAWWQQNPQRNIGLATGSVLVLDFDTYKPEYGEEAAGLLAYLEDEHRTVRADAHGCQLFYRLPDGAPEIRNSSGNLPAAVDVRGAGGYTVLAPSLHPDGYAYRWAEGRAPWEADMLPLPLFVVDLILKRDTRQHRPAPKQGDTTIAAFDSQHRIADLLTKHGYTLAGTHGNLTRLARPGRDGRQTSVVVTVLDGTERSYHHSTTDPLHTEGGARDAFDVFTMLEHGGDARAAYVAAKKALGTWEEEPKAPALDVADEPDDTAEDEPTLPHPLRDVEPVDLADLAPRLGWLHEFAEYAAELGGAPYEFGLLTALTALAAVAAGSVKLEYPITVRPNLYGAIVAPSSVYRKSTTIAAAYDLFRAAETGEAVLGTSITAEALIEQLAERAKVKDEAGNVIGTQPAAGLLVQMELRDILRSDKVKYTVLLKNTLTELFDGYPLKRRLRSGTHEFTESALSIVGGTVPDTIFEDMCDEDWRSGFAARWLFVTTKQEPNFGTPLPDTDPREITEARRRRLADLAGLPRLLFGMPQTPITLTPAALRMWDERRRQTEQAAHQFDNDVLRYTVTRLNTIALKLAMLINLATEGQADWTKARKIETPGDLPRWETPFKGDWTSIDAYTMQTALLLTDYFKSCLADLLDTRDRKAKHTGALQGVLAKIVRANRDGGKYPTAREIQRSYHSIDQSTLQALLDELYRRGAVILLGRRYKAVHDKLPVTK